MAYAPVSNGRAKTMVGTIKRSIGKMVRALTLNCDLAVSEFSIGTVVETYDVAFHRKSCCVVLYPL